MSQTSTVTRKRKQPEAQKPAWSGKSLYCKHSAICLEIYAIKNRYYKRRKYGKRSYSTFKKARSYWRLRGRYSRKNRGYSTRGKWRRYRRVRRFQRRFKRRVQQIARRDHALRVFQRITYGEMIGNVYQLNFTNNVTILGAPSTYTNVSPLIADFADPTQAAATSSLFLQKDSIKVRFTNQTNMMQGLDCYYFKIKRDVSATNYVNISDILADDNGMATLPLPTVRYASPFLGHIAQTYLKLWRHKLKWAAPGRMVKISLKRNVNCKRALNYDIVQDDSYIFRKGDLVCYVKAYPPIVQSTLNTSPSVHGLGNACFSWTYMVT